MALNVCIGPPFTTGSTGELEINGARQLSWPYACGITTENGLCVDSTQGLWVKPYNPAAWSTTANITTPNPLPASPATAWFTGALRVFANPSQCAPMSVQFIMSMMISVSVPNTGSWLEQWGGWYLTNPGATPTTYNMYNSFNSSVAATNYRNTATDTGSFVVPAGGSTTLYYAIGLRNQSSTGTLNPGGLTIFASGTTMNQ